MLDCVGELLVEVLGEGGSWVVGQDPNEHDGIVLDMRAVEVLLGEEDADLSCGGCGCVGACDGGLDNGRQVEDLFTLGMLVGVCMLCSTRHTELAAPDSQKSIYSLSAWWRCDGAV